MISTVWVTHSLPLYWQVLDRTMGLYSENLKNSIKIGALSL